MKPKRRRSRLRILLYFFGILALITYLMNGPVARWGIKRYVSKTLENAGLTGEFKLKGSLAGGFTLIDVRLNGRRSVRKLYIERAKIGYDLDELIEENRVRVLEVEGLDLVADIAYRSPPEKRPPDPPTPFEILSMIQPYIEKNPIEVRGAEISLVKGEESFADFSLGALEHQAGSREIRLLDFVGRRRGGSTDKQDVTITWGPDFMALDRWEILPELGASQVLMSWADGELSRIEGIARLAGSRFEVDFLPDGTIEFHQTGEPFDSREVDHLVGVELPANFRIEVLTGHLDDFKGPFPTWKLEVDAQLSALEWEQLRVDSATLELRHSAGHTAAKLSAAHKQAKLAFNGEVTWPDPENADSWFKSGRGQGELRLEGAGQWLRLAAPVLPPALADLDGGKLEGDVEIGWNKGAIESLEASADQQGFSWKKCALPAAKLTGELVSPSQWQVSVNLTDETLQADARLDLAKMRYDARLRCEKPDPGWLNPLLGLYVADLQLASPPEFSWQGEGPLDAAKGHQGELDLGAASARLADGPLIEATSDISYRWPEFVSVADFDGAYAEFQAAGGLDWRNKRLQIKQLALSSAGEQLVSLDAAFPLSTEIRTLENFLDQPGEIKLDLDTAELSLERIAELTRMDDKIGGIKCRLQAQLAISGTLASPSLKGTLKVAELGGLVEEGLAPLNGELQFATSGGDLKATGTLAEDGRQEFQLQASLPFAPRQWLDNPDSFADVPLEAEASVSQLPLARVFAFIPELPQVVTRLEGKLDLSASLSGPINELDWKASSKLTLEDFRLRKRNIPRIQDLVLEATYADKELKLGSLQALVGGGSVRASGKAAIEGIDGLKIAPVLGEFDLKLKVDHGPVYRDDQVLVRANADLGVKGTLESATISGRIGIVESLFFKDIELLPLGVPSAAVDDFELPKVDTAGKLPVAAPFDAWKLDVAVRLDDPFLIRGNLASGQVTGGIKVGGTLARPAPTGAFELEEITARLPFSRLKVNNSRVIFNPKSGLDPQLQIRGLSQVGNFDVSVFASGPVSNPSVTFSSNPPLPEQEIMTLLASGTTTAGLEDQEVASAKAFQFLLMELKQRSDQPGGNKLFAQLLSVLDNIDVNFGQAGAFTNRRYNAASINFTDNWNFTAMFDREGQTRGLVVFSIRLR